MAYELGHEMWLLWVQLKVIGLSLFGVGEAGQAVTVLRPSLPQVR